MKPGTPTYRDILRQDSVAELVASHPSVFRGKLPRSHSTLPKGWYDLVDSLCLAIGETIEREKIDTFEVFQIKEKFGALRFYHGPDDSNGETITALIKNAHQQSCNLCMDCGAPPTDSEQMCFTRRQCARCANDQRT